MSSGGIGLGERRKAGGAATVCSRSVTRLSTAPATVLLADPKESLGIFVARSRFRRMTLSMIILRPLPSIGYRAAVTKYIFDDAGNMTLEDTSGVQTGYVYDGENRMVKMTASDGSVTTNTYQGDGLRRTRQAQGQSPVTYVWDGSDYLGEIH